MLPTLILKLVVCSVPVSIKEHRSLKVLELDYLRRQKIAKKIKPTQQRKNK